MVDNDFICPWLTLWWNLCIFLDWDGLGNYITAVLLHIIIKWKQVLFFIDKVCGSSRVLSSSLPNYPVSRLLASVGETAGEARLTTYLIVHLTFINVLVVKTRDSYLTPPLMVIYWLILAFLVGSVDISAYFDGIARMVNAFWTRWRAKIHLNAEVCDCVFRFESAGRRSVHQLS